MGDVDAGTIKARAVVEYDPSGLQAFKEDLASLGNAAGSFEQSAGNAGETLSGLGDQAQKSAEGTRALTSSISDLQRPMEGWVTSVSAVNDALAGSQPALIGTGSAFEALQRPVEAASMQLQEASSTMALLPEHTTRVSEEISAAGDSFAQLGDTVGQSVIALPQFADSLHTVDHSFNAAQYGLDDFNENMNVFQDALVNPAPFSMIQQHLNETGQTWDDFTSSIGEGNSAVLENMASSSKSAQTMGNVFYESANSAEEFTKQYNGLNDAMVEADKSINAFGGVGTDMYGPVQMAEKATAGGGFADMFGGFTNTLSQIAMPLMAVQMIGMVVGQVSQGIYDMAATAEGPAAHGVGTFTGTIDALSQASQKAGQSFSENFGQGILPTLNAMNAQSGQNNDFMGFLGKDIGTNLGALADLWQIGTGMNFTGGLQGLANLGASWLGFQQPFQGPAPVPQAQLNYEQQMAALPTTVQGQVYQLRTQTSITLADALNPDYLQAQDQLTASQQLAQRLQASYNASHPINQNQLLADARYQQYVDSQGPPQQQSYPDLFTSFWGNIFGGIGNFLTAPIPAAKNYPGLQSMGASNLDFSGITGDIGQALSSIHLPHLDLSGIASNIGGAISGIQLPHLDLSSIGSSLSGAFSGIEMPHLDLSSISSSLSGAFSGIQIPSLPDIGSRIGGQLSGMFSGITLPSIPDFGARLSGALSGMFAGIGLPTIPDIGAMLNGALSGMFSGIAIPKPPDLGAMLTGAMSGMFSGISLPPIPNLGAALSGALSSMLGSVGTSIPMFASGVEGYSGLAIVGESGPELVSLNGGSVYPMTQSTGGSAPISLGGGGGSAPQSFNIVVNLESQAILSAIGLPLAQTVRVQSGMRGY